MTSLVGDYILVVNGSNALLRISARGGGAFLSRGKAGARRIGNQLHNKQDESKRLSLSLIVPSRPHTYNNRQWQPTTQINKLQAVSLALYKWEQRALTSFVFRWLETVLVGKHRWCSVTIRMSSLPSLSPQSESITETRWSRYAVVVVFIFALCGI